MQISPSETNITADPLKSLYYQVKDKMISEKDMLTNDLTETFWFTIKDKIDNKEILNINIRGEVRTGKSTVGTKITWEINKYLKKKGLFLRRSDERVVNDSDEEIQKRLDNFQMKWVIQSDQTEFIRFIGLEYENVCILIDEWNRLAKTGMNATTEEALFDYYSDVFAGKYVHRVTTSPADVVDNNAIIILDVLGRDREKAVTRCKLTYRNPLDMRMLTLGYVDIYVDDLIIQDFYLAYKEKKFKRMELLDKHGVRDIRELEFAEIVLDTLDELKIMAEVGRVNHRLVAAMVDEVRRKHKRIYSMVTLSEISSKVEAILDMIYEYGKYLTKVKEAKTPRQQDKFKKIIFKLEETIKGRVKEQEKLKLVFEKYKAID